MTKIEFCGNIKELTKKLNKSEDIKLADGDCLEEKVANYYNKYKDKALYKILNTLGITYLKIEKKEESILFSYDGGLFKLEDSFINNSFNYIITNIKYLDNLIVKNKYDIIIRII